MLCQKLIFIHPFLSPRRQKYSNSYAKENGKHA